MTEIENGPRVAESSLPPRTSDEQIDARARVAYRAAVDEMGGFGYDSEKDAFLDGYETAAEAGRERETALEATVKFLGECQQADTAALMAAFKERDELGERETALRAQIERVAQTAREVLNGK